MLASCAPPRLRRAVAEIGPGRSRGVLRPVADAYFSSAPSPQGKEHPLPAIEEQVSGEMDAAACLPALGKYEALAA